MNRPIGQVGQGDSVQDWFNSVPLLTKIFLVSTVVSGAALSFKWISAESMILFWPLVRNKFEVWRLFTSFIYAGPFSFNFAMHTMILYENFRRYESNPFNTGAGGNSADFLYMLLMAMAVLLAVGYYFDMYVLSESLLYVVMYAWSRREPEGQVNIFGFRFKALYLPWIYVAIRLMMGGSVTEPLMGIAVGHLYYYLVEVFPAAHGGRKVIPSTPAFCSSIVEWATGFTPGNNAGGTGVYVHAPPQRAGQQPAAQNMPAAANSRAGAEGLRQRQPATYNWGGGRRLGTD